MNIFITEMKAHRKSIILWCFGMLFLIAASMGKFGGASGSNQDMNELVNGMPKALQAIFGFGGLDLSKASGYFGVIFFYIALIATIHAAMLGANIISKEERDKTSEFLFVKPASRSRIITSKLLAALVNIIIINIFTLISSIIVVGKYANGEAVTGDIAILMIGLFILQLIFMSIGTGLAAFSKNPKFAPSGATGILLVAYLISVLIDLNDKLSPLKYITPFKYFEAKNIMYGAGFDPVFVTLSILITGALIAGTYIFFKKRDLTI